MSLIEKLFGARFTKINEIKVGDELQLKATLVIPFPGLISDQRMNTLFQYTEAFTKLGGHCGDGSLFNRHPKTKDGTTSGKSFLNGYNVAHATEHLATIFSAVDTEGYPVGFTTGSAKYPSGFHIRVWISDPNLQVGYLTKRAKGTVRIVNLLIGRS